jgi:predicted DNA-binding transcriptional regulator YafY
MTKLFEKKGHTTQKSRQKRYFKGNTCLAMILSRLYEGETLSKKELAKECKLDLRTIQRYISERLVGFPIENSGDRFRLASRLSNEVHTDPEDQAVLQMLKTLSREQGPKFYAKAIKLLAKLQNAAANSYFAYLDMEPIDGLLATAAKLEKAIRAKRPVRCRYKMHEGVYDIQIKPLKIALFQGYWYLVAMDARNDTVKKYLLRQIDRIHIEEGTFEEPDGLERAIAKALSVWFDPDAKPFEVRLFIDAEVARYFERKPIGPTQTITGKDPDGSIEITLTITHEMEIVPIIKQWLPHVRVLAPKWIDEIVRNDIAAYLSNSPTVP